ncbi:hypothetical protein CSUI_008939 [Cystoisospora suis]|uniref:Uncharacterized protein n=1 Tax=Cystoisospora suis TaxID=483139 RepID=A0A2C6KKS1_9APIC|nr:hypothetical protein CSUI_008939 [Cystoisospora suis]
MGGDSADDATTSSPGSLVPGGGESGETGNPKAAEEKDQVSASHKDVKDKNESTSSLTKPSGDDRSRVLEENQQQEAQVTSGKEEKESHHEPQAESHAQHESEKRPPPSGEDEQQTHQQEDHSPAAGITPEGHPDGGDHAAKPETAGDSSSGGNNPEHSRQSSRASLQGPQKHQPHPKLHGRKPGKSGGVSSPATSGVATGPQQHQHHPPTLQRRVSQSRLSQRTCRILLDRHRDKILDLLVGGTEEGKKLLERLVVTALCSTLRPPEDVSPTISPRGGGSNSSIQHAIPASGASRGSTNVSSKANNRKTKSGSMAAEASERQYALLKRFLRNHGSPLMAAVFSKLLKEKKECPGEGNEEEGMQIFAACVCDGLGASPPSRVRGLADLIAKTIRALCEESKFQGDTSHAQEGSSLDQEKGDSLHEKKTAKEDQSTQDNSHNNPNEGSLLGPAAENPTPEGATSSQSTTEFKSVKEILEQHKQKDLLRRQSASFSRTNTKVSPEAVPAAATPLQHSNTAPLISKGKEGVRSGKIPKNDSGEKEKETTQSQTINTASLPHPDEKHETESFGIRLLGEALRYAVCEAAPGDEIEQVCKDVCDLVPSVLTHVIKIELQKQAQETKSTHGSSAAAATHHHRPASGSSSSSTSHTGGGTTAGSAGQAHPGGHGHQTHGHHFVKSRQSSTPGNEHATTTKGGVSHGQGARVVHAKAQK